MIIKVLNKNDFNRMMLQNNITVNNITEKDMWVISVNDTEGDKSISYFQNTTSPNILCLYFDDTSDDMDLPSIGTGDMFKLKKMTDSQGKQIIDFLEKIEINLNTNTSLIIHCTAGQNRSGSIGRFAVDFFKYDKRRFDMDNPMVKGNSVVTRVLNRLWLWNHYK